MERFSLCTCHIKPTVSYRLYLSPSQRMVLFSLMLQMTLRRVKNQNKHHSARGLPSYLHPMKIQEKHPSASLTVQNLLQTPVLNLPVSGALPSQRTPQGPLVRYPPLPSLSFLTLHNKALQELRNLTSVSPEGLLTIQHSLRSSAPHELR